MVVLTLQVNLPGPHFEGHTGMCVCVCVCVCVKVYVDVFLCISDGYYITYEQKCVDLVYNGSENSILPLAKAQNYSLHKQKPLHIISSLEYCGMCMN